MLDHHANQAAGLLGLGSQTGPRLLAVVNHGDEQAELPLLWQLCLALVNFGYAVTVLDATTNESDANPGLAELLDHAHWRDDTHRDASAWNVLAAGKGVASLSTLYSPRAMNLAQLGQLFPVDSVVVLYCKVEWMIPLIGDSGIEPLLAVSQTRTSLISSYLALKRLLITGKLKPTIITMIQDLPPASPALELPTAASLGECAKRFLGQNVKTLDILEQMGEENQNGDIQRLALRLMESAVSLAAVQTPSGVDGRRPCFGQTGHFAGSH